MDNVIKVIRKSVYGQEKLYPVNALGKDLADFKGQSTLTNQDVAFLKHMGFKVTLAVVHNDEVVEIGLL